MKKLRTTPQTARTPLNHDPVAAVRTSIMTKQDKSIRTTAKLSPSAWAALERLARNTSQKAILESAIELLNSYCSNASENGSLNEYWKRALAQISDQPRTRKTIVLSGRAMHSLEPLEKRIRQELGFTRDLAFELAIFLFDGVAQNIRQSLKQDEIKAREVIDRMCGSVLSFEDELKRILPEEQPILFRVGMIIVCVQNLLSAIDGELNEGILVDPYDLSQTA